MKCKKRDKKTDENLSQKKKLKNNTYKNYP